MTKRHYAGTYQARRRLLLRHASPLSRCWRCQRLLDEHPPHRNGDPAYWTAGHVRDGDPTSPLMLEASTCNYAAGARRRNELAKRRNGNPTSRRWLDT